MDNLTNIVKNTDTHLSASKSDTLIMDANDENSVKTSSDIQCYDWLDILSQMNKQFFMVVSKDLQVEFISQYTLDFFELGNELSAIPDDLSYKQIIAFMAQKGYMGKADVKRIIKRINIKNQSQISEDNEIISENDGLNIITPSGRHINLQQMQTENDQILVFGNDITQDYIDNHALKLALDSSQSGYGIYHMETRKFSIYGDLLSTHFDKETVDNLTLESLVEIIHPDDRDKCRAAWYKGLDTRKSWRIQFRLMGPDNRNIWIKGHYTPQKSEDDVVTHVICFFSDITYVIRAQSELLQISEQQKETLKAKTDFISRLSHEIRTPMNAVIGIADALVHDNADTADIDKLELIQSSAENILKIVDETLQHSKLEEKKVELNPRPASPVKSIETLCELWADKAKKTQTQLSCQIDPDVPKSIFFDDFRFEQCLNNLISNAIKFAAGGNIQIVQTLTEKGGKKYLITAVKDNGIGMTEPQQVQIFKAYTQADKSIRGRFGGTGLGMSITKDIIELMGGTINVKSEQGKGSIFILTLPIITQALPKSDEKKDVQRDLVEGLLEETVEKASKYEKLNILIVDDNATNQLVLKSLLDNIVGNIFVADDGEHAIEVLSQHPMDCVFMDIHMPGMDGIEATLAIRASNTPYQDTPIIALTADPQYQQKRLCRNIGMNSALGKPVKLNDLLREIDSVLFETGSTQNVLKLTA